MAVGWLYLTGLKVPWHWPECLPFRPVAGDWSECRWPERLWPERHWPERHTSPLKNLKQHYDESEFLLFSQGHHSNSFHYPESFSVILHHLELN
jgi:hypothetical protein